MNNIRIEKDFFFQTAIHFADSFWINSYETTLSMIIETESDWEQNVAIERISHYIKNIIQNTILVDTSDKESIKKYRDAGIRVCELPAEPYDQLFASVLMLKLNSIMEGRLKITDMVLSSVMSEGIRYSIVCEVAEGSYSKNRWWNRACLGIDDSSSTGNVVKLFEDNEWMDLGLSWNELGSK